MADLATLIKLQKWRVDEQRKNLLQAELSTREVEQSLSLHEALVVRELELAREANDPMYNFAAFTERMKMQKQKLLEQLEGCRLREAHARDELALLFEELKRYEIAEDTRAAAEDAKRARDEAAALDEVALNRFQRDD